MYPIYHVLLVYLAHLLRFAHGVVLEDFMIVSSLCDTKGFDVAHWFSESLKLAETAQTAITNAQTGTGLDEVAAEEFLWSIFRIKVGNAASTPRLTQLQAHLNVWNNLVAGNAQYAEKPWLFCTNEWLLEMKPSSIAVGPGGNPIKTVRNGQVVWKTVAQQFRELHGQDIPNGLRIFWSADLDIYYSTYQSIPCEAADDFGETETGLKTAFIVLCEVARDDEDTFDNLDILNVNEGMVLDKVLPKSGTLFHELFHLGLGIANSHDLSYEFDDLETFVTIDPMDLDAVAATLAGPSPEDATHTLGQDMLSNPESWVWLSAGYWYWLQDYAVSQRLLFSSGVGKEIFVS